MLPVPTDAAPSVSDPRWNAALRAVVEEPERLTLHAQPIVELTAGAVAGFELLSRFAGPWSATPDVWFAAAEAWGVNTLLQARVLRRAIESRAALPPNTFVTVNIDPHLLRSPEVADVLTASEDLSRLVLELTEHTRIDGSDVLPFEVLSHVRGAGGMVAMDDAGTGYAGLSTLLAVRPQIVKLDRELISGLDHDPVKRALLEVFGDLAGRMDAWILAEGVETMAELDAVIALGVPLAQGWALGRAEGAMPDRLSVPLVEHIRRTAARSSLRECVASLIRPVRVVGTDPLTADVLLDHRGLAHRVRLAGSDSWAPATLVAPSTTLPDAARRAAARDVVDRFAPLVCTDGQGVVIGTVGIDDLLVALSASTS